MAAVCWGAVFWGAVPPGRSSARLRRGGSFALGEDFVVDFFFVRGFGATFFATSAGVTVASGSTGAATRSGLEADSG